LPMLSLQLTVLHVLLQLSTLLSLRVLRSTASRVCVCLQLFTLFFMHAYGGHLWPSKQQQLQQERGQQSVAESMLCMDVPWRRYWPCLLPWLILEATPSVAWLHNAVSESLNLPALFAMTTRFDGGSLTSCERVMRHGASGLLLCMLLVRTGFWLDLVEEYRGLLHGSGSASAGLATALCNTSMPEQ